MTKKDGGNKNGNTTPSYQIWRIGNLNDIQTDSVGGALIVGGGTDPEDGFAWLIANAKGGDYVTLRAFGDDAYNEWIMSISEQTGNPLNSVTTILFNDREASFAPEVIDLIKGAEAVFFAGGDQAYYIDYWVDSPVQTIIQNNLTRLSVGGTSAGTAILGNWIYGCMDDCSVTSERAMANPYYSCMANSNFVPAFLKIPYMEQILTDTHFVTRNRMGRLCTFLALDTPRREHAH